MFLKKIIRIICLVAMTSIYPNLVKADDFKLMPSVSVREEYNDNIFFQYSDPIDDFITTVSAGLELSERTERMDLDLSGTVSPFFYADNNEWDDVDQNYLGKISYQVSPRFGLNANAGYNVSNRPDRDVYDTGLVQSNNRRKRQKYGIDFNNRLTEYSAMGILFAYSRDEYDQGNVPNENQKVYKAGLNYTHDMNQWWENTTGRLNVGFNRSEYETSDTDNYSATIGMQHWFSQIVNLLVDVGVRYTEANYLTPQLVFVPPASIQLVNVEVNNTSFGGTGQAVLTIQGELTQGSVRLSHGINPGREHTVQRTDAVLDIRRRLGEMFTVGMACGYYHNSADRDEFSFQEIDEDTFYIRPIMQWEIFKNFILEGGYVFTYIDDHSASNDRKQNMVYMQASYGFPLFE